MKTIGFTGTRNGMTKAQESEVIALAVKFHEKDFRQARHGVCKGADAQFHTIVKAIGFHVVGHPGIRRDGNVYTRADVECDVVLPSKYFLDRDHDIVDNSDVMIATPKGMNEKFRGSGTWATIRYARRQRKPRYIVYPNGEVVWEDLALFF